MKSVLIDTNLLLLYLVGDVAPSKIGVQRRLRKFDLNDLEILHKLIGDFQRHVSLPNVLSETSNFIGAGKQEIAPGAASCLAGYCQIVEEICLESSSVTRSPYYTRLGLTDAAIIEIGKQKVTILTDDHELYGNLHGIGLNAINLYHYKTPF